MFVGCSEISISVIVKYVEHLGITSACSLPWAGLLRFSVSERREKIARLWFTGNISTQANTILNVII